MSAPGLVASSCMIALQTDPCADAAIPCAVCGDVGCDLAVKRASATDGVIAAFHIRCVTRLQATPEVPALSKRTAATVDRVDLFDQRRGSFGQGDVGFFSTTKRG